jgi:hypothetical protein
MMGIQTQSRKNSIRFPSSRSSSSKKKNKTTQTVSKKSSCCCLYLETLKEVFFFSSYDARENTLQAKKKMFCPFDEFTKKNHRDAIHPSLSFSLTPILVVKMEAIRIRKINNLQREHVQNTSQATTLLLAT